MVARLAADLPDVAGYTAEDGRGEAHLGAFLRRLGGDDELIVQCVALLYRNGMSIEGLNDSLANANIDLGAAVTRYADLLSETRSPPRAGGYPSVLDDCRTVLRGG